jgi:hypothetical protein
MPVDDNGDYLLGLRSNLIHYVRFLDTFGPCIVGVKTWNNDTRMEHMSGGTNMGASFDGLLSVSDETFMVLVVLNYGARWSGELEKERKQVCSG